MTNEELIIKKLKEITGKLLTISKKIKALEEKKVVEVEFFPNEKFLSWYTGSFVDGEELPKETTEEIAEAEEEVVEDSPETVSEELTETLEELDEAINDA